MDLTGLAIAVHLRVQPDDFGKIAVLAENKPVRSGVVIEAVQPLVIHHGGQITALYGTVTGQSALPPGDMLRLLGVYILPRC